MDELVPEWERHLEEIRIRKGPCPSLETLGEYYADKLPEAEAAAIREHVSACGSCELKLLRLEGPLEAEDDVKPARSLWVRAGATKALAGLAAGLAIGFLIPREQRPQVPVPPPVAAAARTAKVLRLNDTVRSSAAIPSLTLGDDESFVLYVSVPTPAGAQYRAEITRQGGEAVASLPARAADANGSFAVVSESRRFPAAHYELRLEPVNDSSAPRYQFEFRIEK